MIEMISGAARRIGDRRPARLSTHIGPVIDNERSGGSSAYRAQ